MFPEVVYVLPHVVDVGPLAVAHPVAAVVVAENVELVGEEGLERERLCWCNTGSNKPGVTWPL